MPTIKEIKQIERVIGKPYSQIETSDIPAYIRDRESIKEIISNEELTDMFGEGGKEDVMEYYGAYQDENGEWIV